MIKYNGMILLSMNLSSRKNEVSIHSYSSAADYLEPIIAQRPIIRNATCNSNNNYFDDAINHLDIDGLKDTLVRYGFKLDSLVTMQPP